MAYVWHRRIALGGELLRASGLTMHLNQRLLDFIAFFNRTAKPFKWTYTGRPLCV